MSAKRYTAIIKVSHGRFIKYRNVSNLRALSAYLDEHFTGWRWCNLYDAATRQQVGSFTNRHKPTTRTL